MNIYKNLTNKKYLLLYVAGEFYEGFTFSK